MNTWRKRPKLAVSWVSRLRHSLSDCARWLARRVCKQVMSTAIEFHGVSKRYRFFGLEDVSFRLEQGQIMGFVGPNGAGKTTTMRILMAMIRQDEGAVEVLGCSMPDD